MATDPTNPDLPVVKPFTKPVVYGFLLAVVSLLGAVLLRKLAGEELPELLYYLGLNWAVERPVRIDDGFGMFIAALFFSGLTAVGGCLAVAILSVILNLIGLGHGHRVSKITSAVGLGLVALAGFIFLNVLYP